MTHREIYAIQSDLNRLMHGSALDSSDFGYAATVAIDNNRVTHEPWLVALPSSAKDVGEIVKYCTEHRVRLTTKSGGHSAAGYCLNSEGIVIDMANMNKVSFIDGGKGLAIGAGTRWIKAYNFLLDRQSEYVAVGGGCASVGVAGFILGGGYSFISRSFGLGSDNVSGMEFVSADGEIIELSDAGSDKNSHDLYWALRGAGGGNFGVVTRIDLQLQKTHTPRLMMGQISFPFYRIEEVMRFYNEWAPTLPNELAVYGMLRRFPDPRRGGRPRLALRFTPVFNGSLSEGMQLIKPLTELGPDSVELYSMNLPEWENYIGTATQIKGNSAYIRSLVIPAGGLDEQVSHICKKFMSRAPSDNSYVVWTHTGGAIKNRTGGCYAHRDTEYTFEVKSVWDASMPFLIRPNVTWAVDFFDELGKHAKGAYINYIDPLLTDWQNQYYLQHYKQLLEVKQHWDPKGVFDFQQGIGSLYCASRKTPLDLSPLTKTF